MQPKSQQRKLLTEGFRFEPQPGRDDVENESDQEMLSSSSATDGEHLSCIQPILSYFVLLFCTPTCTWRSILVMMASADCVLFGKQCGYVLYD